MNSSVKSLFDKLSLALNLSKKNRPSMEEIHSEFYLQKDIVSMEYSDLNRFDIFSKYCKNARVLHVGCTQYPITDINNSLHIELASVCKLIDGFDVDHSGYKVLAPYVHNGRFLEDLTEATEYDLVIIPEVLEHVGNVQDFFALMSNIKSKRYIVTVPDIYQCMDRHFRATKNGEFSNVSEGVHPDHNYWFSPYTLRNTINKYTDWSLDGLFWINKISLMAVCSSVELRVTK